MAAPDYLVQRNRKLDRVNNDHQDQSSRAQRGVTPRIPASRSAALSVTGVAAPWALNLAAIGEAAAQSRQRLQGAGLRLPLRRQRSRQHAGALRHHHLQQLRTLRGRFGAGSRHARRHRCWRPSSRCPAARSTRWRRSLRRSSRCSTPGAWRVCSTSARLSSRPPRPQYDAQSVPLPPKLFSHNDQQSVWQACTPEGATSGWGGRIGDLFAAGNGGAIFTAVSVTGNAVYLSGQTRCSTRSRPAARWRINGLGEASTARPPRPLRCAPDHHRTRGDRFERRARARGAAFDRCRRDLARRAGARQPRRTAFLQQRSARSSRWWRA